MRIRVTTIPLLFASLLFFTVSGCSVGNSQQVAVQAQSTFEENLRPRYWIGNEIMPRYTLAERMDHYGVAGVAVAIIENGELVSATGYGVLQAGGGDMVDGDTLFSAGSVSKIATAMMLLKMNDDGQLDIDQPLSRYLTSWTLPDNEFGKADDITLRMIMSHTAGFNIHGFRDFAPGEALPSVVETLNGQAPAGNAPLTLISSPGARFKYSGGGYTLAQLIISDVASKDFPDAASDILLDPLGMTRSSYVNPLPVDVDNVAKAHDRGGEPTALPRGYEAMPETAASGLWTSANELGRLVAALIRSYRTDDGYLSQSLAIDMMTKVSPSEHGLGPRLEGMGQDRFFHHAGSNNSYRAWIEGHLATGDGLVVLTNGARGNDLFVEIRNAVADTRGWRINQAVLAPVISIPVELLTGFAGNYRPSPEFPLPEREQLVGGFFDATLTVSLIDGGLELSRLGSERTIRLIPLAPNRFIVSDIGLREGIVEIVFHRDAWARTLSMTVEVPGARSYYTRAPGTE